MEAKTFALPHGIIVQWKPVETAINYHLTLFDPKDWFMCEIIVEREKCFFVFKDLNVRNENGRVLSYKINIKASNRLGEIIDETIVSGTPSGTYSTFGQIFNSSSVYRRD